MDLWTLGKFIPFFLERMDEALFAEHEPMCKLSPQKFIQNQHVSKNRQLISKKEVGIDRILYAADYPYLSMKN